MLMLMLMLKSDKLNQMSLIPGFVCRHMIKNNFEFNKIFGENGKHPEMSTDFL